MIFLETRMHFLSREFFLGITNQPSSERIYKQINRRTEFITKVIVYTTIYVLYPIIMILILIFNFYMFFFTDSGVGVFRLLIPYWYASVCECVYE